MISFPANGKKPIPSKWTRLTKSMPIQPGQNTAILTGARSNITVIDIDVAKTDDPENLVDGLELWEQLVDQYAEMPDTPYVLTGSGGYHYYFEYNPLVKTRAHAVTLVKNGIPYKVKIDVRNDGGCVIAPPSIHPLTGQPYSWCQEGTPQPMPAWLIDALTYPISYNEDGDLMILSELSDIPETQIRPTSIESANSNLLRSILLNLHPSRADDRDDWLRICFACATVGRDNGFDALPITQEWSRQSALYNEAETERNYRESRFDISIKTLWWMLLRDNPEKYYELSAIQEQEFNKIYYYSDDDELVKEMRTKGTLPLHKVKNYIRSAFMLIMNFGKTCWAVRDKDKNGKDIWIKLRGRPRLNDIDFDFTDNDKPYTLKKVFVAMQLEHDITRYDTFDKAPPISRRL